jgi:hypothetical protein
LGLPFNILVHTGFLDDEALWYLMILDASHVGAAGPVMERQELKLNSPLGSIYGIVCKVEMELSRTRQAGAQTDLT